MLSTRHNKYWAPITNGVVQAPELVPNSDIVSGSGPPVIDPMTSITLSGGALVEIEEAFHAVRARYQPVVAMAEMVISYTLVRVDGDDRTDRAIIIFMTPTDPGGDYTVHTRNQVVERSYRGSVTGTWFYGLTP